MIDELLEVEPGESLDEMRARFGRALGWAEPVPVGAFMRALQDESYCSYLIASRDAPGFLRPLLEDPANERYAPSAAQAQAPGSQSNVALAGRAAKALARWGRAGFSTADEETVARREAACLACPHLSEPRAALQRMLPGRPAGAEPGRRTGEKVCSMCGCQVARKMRLPSESCPQEDPLRPGYTRWGEPVRSRAAGAAVPVA
jgi:hypothetical protein